MTREQKIKKDAKVLRKYEQRLRQEKKVYIQTFEAYAVNQRRSRAAAIGECALQAREAVRSLSMVKDLVDGTLDYMIREEKVKDPDGKKGFHCAVTFKVMSHEPAHTDEWIQAEMEKTFEQLMQETDEMFPEEKKEEKEDG
jgi:hypothetical protein